VFKALAESRVKLDILAGTSIGGINAAIVAGSKDKQPEFALTILARACGKFN
jgi:NTE family protein